MGAIPPRWCRILQKSREAVLLALVIEQNRKSLKFGIPPALRLARFVMNAYKVVCGLAASSWNAFEMALSAFIRDSCAAAELAMVRTSETAPRVKYKTPKPVIKVSMTAVKTVAAPYCCVRFGILIAGLFILVARGISR